MSKRQIGIVALLIGMLFCMRAALTQTSQLMVSVDQSPACADPATLQELISEEEDKYAFNKDLGVWVQSGQCTMLKRGQNVIVTGYSPETKLMRIVLEELPVEYWTSERSTGPSMSRYRSPGRGSPGWHSCRRCSARA
jgi:hypothetical protein